MTARMIFATIVEVGLSALVIWGVFNEDKFIAFEDKIVALVKSKIKRR